MTPWILNDRPICLESTIFHHEARGSFDYSFRCLDNGNPQRARAKAGEGEEGKYRGRCLSVRLRGVMRDRGKSVKPGVSGWTFDRGRRVKGKREDERSGEGDKELSGIKREEGQSIKDLMELWFEKKRLRGEKIDKKKDRTKEDKTLIICLHPQNY